MCILTISMIACAKLKAIFWGRARPEDTFEYMKYFNKYYLLFNKTNREQNLLIS